MNFIQKSVHSPKGVQMVSVSPLVERAHSWTSSHSLTSCESFVRLKGKFPLVTAGLQFSIFSLFCEFMG